MPSITRPSTRGEEPLFFSIVIGVYNDWAPLDRCLQSVAEQTNSPSFELIVVDDGSQEVAPEFIRRWADRYRLTIVRQPHAGISAARNHGIRASKGSVLVFVDADCRFQANCLAALGSAITASREHSSFQLHLIGDCSRLVGKVEQLRLITLQNHLLQPNGCIRYLNTAGFALRRSRVDVEKEVFNPVALRGEDTLLLTDLMRDGELPLFLPDAVVQHAIPLSVVACVRKDFRSAYLEARTYELMSRKGVRIRVSHGERLRMLVSMWKTSRQDSIGRLAWFLLVGRQALRRALSFAYRCLRLDRG